MHKKTADRLERLGLIVRDVRTSRDRFGTLRVEFHRLTHLGRYTYCQTCEDEPPSPTPLQTGGKE